MDKAGIQAGVEYVFREPPRPGAPIQRVRILEHVRGRKWKVEWIEPNPGLVDYVESKNLVVPWKQRQPFLRDEEREQRLREDADRHRGRPETPVERALSEIFESTKDQLTFHRGILTGQPDSLNRVKERAGLDPARNHPLSYVDRGGGAHVAFEEALELAQAFCAKEPSTVLAEIEATERRWSMESRQTAEEYLVDLLNEYRASWAIIRQWTGHDPAVAEREAQYPAARAPRLGCGLRLAEGWARQRGGPAAASAEPKLTT